MATKTEYHTSKPPTPNGMVQMTIWAKDHGLSAVCVQRWIYAGKLKGYRIPGYGTRTFIKAQEAEKLLAPKEFQPRICQ